MSVIVPARNEAHHITACVTSILSSDWPRLEVIVVDDHSHDGTAAMARRAALGDRRLVIVTPPPLPSDWLGKQWACAQGAASASGDVLLFTDADVRHGRELHARIVNAMEETHADLLSVAGDQEMRTFWERVIQPFIFCILAIRFGGPGTVNRSRRAQSKIANGQCLAFRRDAYVAFGGHAAVRDHAAEDLAFAQRMFLAGYRTFLTLGTRHMTTRMYSSLREIIDGWGKNVYAAGRDALPGGWIGRALARALIPLPGLIALAPFLALAACAWSGAQEALVTFATVTLALELLWSAIAVRHFRLPTRWALGFPLGAVAYLYLSLRAVVRGRRIEWKGREYRTAAK